MHKSIKEIFQYAVAAAAGVAFAAVVIPLWNESTKPAQVQRPSTHEPTPINSEKDVRDPELRAIIDQAAVVKKNMDEMTANSDRIMNNLAIDAMERGRVEFAGNKATATIQVQNDSSYVYNFTFQGGVAQEICYSGKEDCKSVASGDAVQEADEGQTKRPLSLNSEQANSLIQAACVAATKQKEKALLFTIQNCYGVKLPVPGLS
ncbi:MAG: hypothetical protein JWO78_1549 [Micavibrio sp.]|nr:hypothetical protein [Micavibrio sp.]